MRKLLGLLGSAMLFIFVFTPIVGLPFLGNRSYFQYGQFDAIIILVVAVFSVFLTLSKSLRFLIFTGAGSIALSFLSFWVRMDQMQTNVRQAMPNNPLGSARLANDIKIEWGWIVLCVGALALIVTALIREPVKQNHQGGVGDVFNFPGLPTVSNSKLYLLLGIIFGSWLTLITYNFLV